MRPNQGPNQPPSTEKQPASRRFGDALVPMLSWGSMSGSAPPTVVIVGRPNVGKSTLFNRITGSRRSIVGNEPGITRDRIHLEAEWRGRRFKLIDTGGMIFRSREEFSTLVEQQARKAIEEAAHVIFVVDGRSEITATDRDLADLLRRGSLAVSLAVNKCDTQTREVLASEFHELGIADVFPVSAEHNRGVEALLARVTEGFPVSEASDPDPSVVPSSHHRAAERRQIDLVKQVNQDGKSHCFRDARNDPGRR